MDYKKHIIIALFFSFIYLYLVKTPFDWFILIYFLISIIYAILPDIDILTSIIRRITLVLSMIYLYYLYFLEKTHTNLLIFGGVICLNIVLFLLKHRGFIHSFLAGFFFALPLGYYNLTYFFVAIISYYSHLLADLELKLI